MKTTQLHGQVSKVQLETEQWQKRTELEEQS